MYILRSEQSAVKIFNGEVIAASGDSSSVDIDVRRIKGYLSLAWTITGNGTGKFEVLSAVNGIDYLDINADIAASQTKTTGPGSDGKNAASFISVPCPALRIKVTETGGANSITVSAWIYGS